MAFDFPQNPDIGQLYQPVAEGPTYEWDGAFWIAWDAEAPPEAPLDGQVYGRKTGTWVPVLEAGGWAPIDSPAFTGNPTAPTPLLGDNDTSVATTAFVLAQISAAGGFPEAPNDGNSYARQSLGWNNLADEFAAKAATVHSHGQADITNLVSDLALKAPLVSPVFTGDPRVPTPAPTDNDTSIPSTAWVNTAIAAAVTAGGGFPEAPNDGGYYARRNLAWSNTVGLFAPAVHVHVIADTTGLQAALDAKAALDSPHFAGIPTAPTAADATYTTQLATTQFVGTAVAQAGVAKANIDNPTFTGNPKAPTPAAGDNDTSIATTAFVTAAVAAATVVETVLGPGTTTYTKPANLRYIEVWGQAAGGAGNASAVGVAAELSTAGGGGGGGAFYRLFAAAELPASLSVVVGSGGAAPGGAGGNTSFGALCTAIGGGGAVGAYGSGSTPAMSAAGGAGGTASGGTLNLRGGNGINGVRVSGAAGISGAGGAAPLGSQGATGQAISSQGAAGTCGDGGASAMRIGAGGALLGGNGGDGYLKMREIF